MTAINWLMLFEEINFWVPYSTQLISSARHLNKSRASMKEQYIIS
jgi:hypothetical protein